VSRFIDELKRTHYCGELRASDIGKEVVLFGWVAFRRDFGGCVFIDLRDREGLAQVVFDLTYTPNNVVRVPDLAEDSGPFFTDDGIREAHELAENVRREWVVGVRGVVVHRGESNVNPKLATGEVEVRVVEATVFNRAENPPFPLVDDLKTDEDIRLANRYLDLRRTPLQRTLRMRHRMNLVTRNYLAEQGCLELETPFLVKYTPGGARNFLVPSRLSPGKFYALAESPQLYKQLFMVSGFDRYFQIVKCFRDEDLRVDRQPEFTQIDVELSFVGQDDIFRLIEGLVFALWKRGARRGAPGSLPQRAFPAAAVLRVDGALRQRQARHALRSPTPISPSW
jgi:aspartyl-tRNA synthetase